MLVGDKVSNTGELRQGDVIGLSWIPTVEDGQLGKHLTPSGVVVISQTCDVVQVGTSKVNITVAPLLASPTPNQIADARRGRAPLMLHLPRMGGTEEAVADMQRTASIPKSGLPGTRLLGRHVEEESSFEARDLSERIGRVYSRFAFPDPVVAVLDKFKIKARKSAGGQGGFGRVLEHLDLRIQADQWNNPGRTLTLFVVVRSSVLINREDADPGWSLSTAKIVGLKKSESLVKADLTRLSELLADTCADYENDAEKSDGTSLLELWTLWGQRLQQELLDTRVNDEVIAFNLELLGDDEITVATWRRTATLDLEDLSEPEMAISRDTYRNDP